MSSAKDEESTGTSIISNSTLSADHSNEDGGVLSEPSKESLNTDDKGSTGTSSVNASEAKTDQNPYFDAAIISGSGDIKAKPIARTAATVVTLPETKHPKTTPASRKATVEEEGRAAVNASASAPAPAAASPLEGDSSHTSASDSQAIAQALSLAQAQINAAHLNGQSHPTQAQEPHKLPTSNGFTHRVETVPFTLNHNGSNNVSTLSTPSVEVETVLFPPTGDYITNGGGTDTETATGTNRNPEVQTPSILSDEYLTDDMIGSSSAYRSLPVSHNAPPNQIHHQHPSLHSHPSAIISAGGLKGRKSVDNVKLTKKKKNSRPATTKAEKFAAKIARAVDEVDSSDSDETFVYDSNPMSGTPGIAPHGQGAAMLGEPSSVTTVRPRFQSRNPSASSLAVFEGLTTSGTAPGLTTDSNSGSEPSVRRNSLNENATNGQQATLATSSDRPPSVGYSEAPENSSELDSSASQYVAPPRQVSHKHTSGSSHKRGLGSPRVASSSAVAGPDSSIAAAAAGGAAKYSSLNGNSQLPLPNLRGKPSRMFAVAANNSNNPNNSSSAASASNSIVGVGKNSRRWRNALSTRYMDEDDDDESEGDIDEDDDYLDTVPSETTPLRHAMHGIHSPSHIHGNSAGVTTGGVARGLRSSRKNGNVVLYSPHNYRQQPQASQRFYFIRIILWVAFFLVFVLGFGFTLGFLLATSKPLQDVYITNVFNILASDEELAFEMVLLGFNPGLLSVTIETCDLDVFARSPYVADPEDDSMWDSIGQEATEHTMRLGTVSSFDVPLVFEGGFFDHRMFKAVGDIRLKDPGLNSTIDDEDGGFIRKPDSSKKPDGRDDGQKRWSRVSVHPFDLSVRGVVHYELFMGRKHSLSVSKTLHVDPNADGLRVG